MKKNLKNISYALLLLISVANPVLILAEETIPKATVVVEENPYQYAGNPNLSPAEVYKLIAESIGKASTTSSGSNGNSAVNGGVSSAGGCLGGQVLAKAVTDAIGSTVSDLASSATNVPVAESGSVADNIKREASARVGTPILGGVSLPSWDSVAYCIVNGMIAYIANSTIQWINTGFNGNPAFLENPDQFFKQLADEEAASFVQNLAYGTLGVNVCEVYRATMVKAILNQYAQQNQRSGNYQNGGYGGGKGISNGFLGCSFDQNPNKLNSFLKGNFIQGGGWDTWYKLTQNTKNNPYDTYFNTQDRLNRQIDSVQASTNKELDRNNGFLTFKKCPTGQEGKLNQTGCTSVTPGSVIQDQLNSTLNLGKNRLVLADKFDQVVEALVNQLIQTAIGHVLEGTNN